MNKPKYEPKTLFWSIIFILVVVIVPMLTITHYDKKIMEAKSEALQLGYTQGFHSGRHEGKSEALEDMESVEQRILSKLHKHDMATAGTAENFISTEKMLDKIMDKSNKSLSEEKRKIYKKSIIKWSREYGLSPIFVASVIHRETNFRENAVSKSNARGCMQVIAKYHPEKLKKAGIAEKGLHGIDAGINVGCQVIREYLDWKDGDYREAMLKYVGSVKNSGEGYVNDIFNMVIYAYSKEVE